MWSPPLHPGPLALLPSGRWRGHRCSLICHRDGDGNSNKRGRAAVIWAAGGMEAADRRLYERKRKHRPAAALS